MTRWAIGVLLVFSATALAETYTYDSAGRLASVLYDDAAGTLIRYSYDANGNLVRQLSTTDGIFDSGFES